MAQSKETEHFWIDAFCIDQDNTLEKEQQVRLMGEVFAAAKNVIAWLGEPSDDSDVAIQFVSILNSAIAGFMTGENHLPWIALLNRHCVSIRHLDGHPS